MTQTKTRRPAPPARIGRPPTGADGEKVSTYPQMTIRLSDDSKRLLEAIVGMTGRPMWRVMEDALKAYVEALPADERALLASIRRRRARGM